MRFLAWRFGVAAVVAGTILLGASEARSAANLRTPRASMNRVQPEMKFTGVALRDALNFLRDVSGANLHVNWKALEGVGVSADTPINLRLRGVSLRKTLSLVLAETGASESITWYFDQNVIEVTTREIANRQLITRVYDVSDLLMEIPDFAAPDLSDMTNIQSNSNNGTRGSRGSIGGGGGGGLFGGGNQSTDRNKDEDKGKTKDERAQDLVTLIQSVIYPDIWRDNGGPASIRYWDGRLIVTAPRHVLEAIGGPVD